MLVLFEEPPGRDISQFHHEFPCSCRLCAISFLCLLFLHVFHFPNDKYIYKTTTKSWMSNPVESNGFKSLQSWVVSSLDSSDNDSVKRRNYGTILAWYISRESPQINGERSNLVFLSCRKSSVKERPFPDKNYTKRFWFILDHFISTESLLVRSFCVVVLVAVNFPKPGSYVNLLITW